MLKHPSKIEPDHAKREENGAADKPGDHHQTCPSLDADRVYPFAIEQIQDLQDSKR